MYNCPDSGCDSCPFRRVVKQEETLTYHPETGDLLNVEPGDVHTVSLIECAVCGAEVTA